MKPTTKLYVDGGMNTQTGNEAWGCVTFENGKCALSKVSDQHVLDGLKIKEVELPVGIRRVIVSKFGDVQQETNGAELLSMVAALSISVSTTKVSVTHIHTDSKLVYEYWSNPEWVKANDHKLTKKILKGKMNPIKLDTIHRCAKLRAQYEEMGGKIIKISGDDNPADLGYHKM